jgi:hypothetical protein
VKLDLPAMSNCSGTDYLQIQVKYWLAKVIQLWYWLPPDPGSTYYWLTLEIQLRYRLPPDQDVILTNYRNLIAVSATPRSRCIIDQTIDIQLWFINYLKMLVQCWLILHRITCTVELTTSRFRWGYRWPTNLVVILTTLRFRYKYWLFQFQVRC